MYDMLGCLTNIILSIRLKITTNVLILVHTALIMCAVVAITFLSFIELYYLG